MGKRKASIFNVAEYVSHWLEANAIYPSLLQLTREDQFRCIAAAVLQPRSDQPPQSPNQPRLTG